LIAQILIHPPPPPLSIFQQQVSLKVGEIKGLKGGIDKLKQEMKTKDEMMAQFQKENQTLKDRIVKMKIRLRGKGLL
jgi:peptidoglycan hydrolase CwlO-like protein